MIVIRCDCCDNDLTTTGNAVGYRLALTPESMQVAAGFVTMMHVEPPLDRECHFCGLPCLRKWLGGG